jgi:hypothetical protein
MTEFDWSAPIARVRSPPSTCHRIGQRTQAAIRALVRACASAGALPTRLGSRASGGFASHSPSPTSQKPYRSGCFRYSSRRRRIRAEHRSHTQIRLAATPLPRCGKLRRGGCQLDQTGRLGVDVAAHRSALCFLAWQSTCAIFELRPLHCAQNLRSFARRRFSCPGAYAALLSVCPRVAQSKAYTASHSLARDPSPCAPTSSLGRMGGAMLGGGRGRADFFEPARVCDIIRRLPKGNFCSSPGVSLR